MPTIMSPQEFKLLIVNANNNPAIQEEIGSTFVALMSDPEFPEWLASALLTFAEDHFNSMVEANVPEDYAMVMAPQAGLVTVFLGAFEAGRRFNQAQTPESVEDFDAALAALVAEEEDK